jgi:hypothetical protein
MRVNRYKSLGWGLALALASALLYILTKPRKEP